MNSTILTNRVELKIHAEKVDEKFDIWLVKTDLLGKTNYGPVVNTIYKEVQPLALTSIDKGSYVVLLPKKAKVMFDNPHYALNKVTAKDLAKIACARLLINAMPNLSDVQPRSSEGVGLYYLSDIEKIGQAEVLRTFEIKLTQTGADILLGVNGTTFTPVQYHTNVNGELYNDCAHFPRLSFNKWTQELNRARNGEFIKKKHRDRKMKSEMVSLDTKKPGKFWKSKIGVLAQFIQDVERELNGMLCIEFIPLSSSYRMRFKDADISRTYKDIDGILAGYVVNIVNMTNVNTEALEIALASDSIAYEHSSNVKLAVLNLVIHHPAEYYEGAGQEDPYCALRSDPKIIVQSIYPETLFSEDALARAQYEACKKELLIKIEVNENALRLVKPKGNWAFIKCIEVDKDGKKLIYHVLRLQDGNLSYCQLDPDCAEELIISLPGILIKNGYAVINEISGEGFIIKETGIVALPEFQSLSKIMSELEKGFDNGIPRNWITEFLNLLKSGKIEPKNAALVEEKLNCLLEATVNKERITKEVLLDNKETKLTYRGSLQTFFDWVTDEKGFRLGASLKSQNAGYIEASLGLFYNNEEHLYFVGDKDNVKSSVPRFCKVRKIVTDSNEVPEELLKMMKVFHVRHKQATVYPFLFKHLAEYEERARIKA